MDKTLFLHIGTGKTGTTAIQHFFKKNENVLREVLNVNYCAAGRGSGINHRLIDLNATKRKLSDYRRIRKLIIEINDEILSSTCNRHIVSDEDFPGLTLSEIFWYQKLLNDNIKIKIIIYLRRQDQFLESWYNQLVKTGNYSLDIFSLQKILENSGIFDYYSLVKKWAEVFGKNNILVRVFSKNNLVNSNVIDDFSELTIGRVINLPHKGLINVSLSKSNIELIKNIYKKEWSREVLSDNFINQLLLKQSPTDEKYSISLEQKESVLIDCVKYNRLLSEYYFSGKIIFK